MSDEEISEDQKIADEYSTWKKNCPVMYETVTETALLWPSLTVQWFKGQLILGTYSSGSDDDFLETASWTESSDPANSDQETASKQVKVDRKIKHDGEVNRARYNPGDDRIIATASSGGNVYLFNVDDLADSSETEFKPTSTLTHHSENLYGLSWNRNDKTVLATGSDDSTVAIW